MEHFIRRKAFVSRPTNMFGYMLERLQGISRPRRGYRSAIRQNISLRERLVITLRFLASGACQRLFSFPFRLGASTVHYLWLETCDLIWRAFASEFLRVPSSRKEWLAICADFNRLWNFPHCICAIDGKHITLRCPPNSEKTYYNYKGRFSIHLLGVCDAHYRSIWANIGCEGRKSDGGVLAQSQFAMRGCIGRSHLAILSRWWWRFSFEELAAEAISRPRPFRRKTHF